MKAVLVDSTATSDAGPNPVPDLAGVFQQEFQYVWRTVRRLGVHERDLEDVTHEVFLRVQAQLPLFDSTRPLRAWLFGIALGVAANYRRLARHRVDLLESCGEIADDAQSPHEELEGIEKSRSVRAALRSVPLDQRAVLVLHELDGYPIPEVALTLGINVNTAYSRLRLARDSFRSAFRRLAATRGAR
jgi:RNA polymerase sigma-70 factor (ECF subfamily)